MPTSFSSARIGLVAILFTGSACETQPRTTAAVPRRESSVPRPASGTGMAPAPIQTATAQVLADYDSAQATLVYGQFLVVPHREESHRVGIFYRVLPSYAWQELPDAGYLRLSGEPAEALDTANVDHQGPPELLVRSEQRSDGSGFHSVCQHVTLYRVGAYTQAVWRVPVYYSESGSSTPGGTVSQAIRIGYGGITVGPIKTKGSGGDDEECARPHLRAGRYQLAGNIVSFYK